jgi:MSHA biogenesis protein MshP
MKQMQRGFSIVSAIFVLVVLAFLGVAMVTFSTTQHQTAAMDVMGSRAYQAARAGIEWGAFQVLPASGGVYATACRAAPTSSVLAAGTLAGTLGGFVVTVNCSATAHSDAAAAVTMYQLTSTATQGAAGTPDYVERRLQVSIAQ